MSVLQSDEKRMRRCDTTQRAESPVITASDADLLYEPVKHLYQLIRSELTACPAAVESKTCESENATRSNINAE